MFGFLLVSFQIWGFPRDQCLFRPLNSGSTMVIKDDVGATINPIKSSKHMDVCQNYMPSGWFPIPLQIHEALADAQLGCLLMSDILSKV